MTGLLQKSQQFCAVPTGSGHGVPRVRPCCSFSTDSCSLGRSQARCSSCSLSPDSALRYSHAPDGHTGFIQVPKLRVLLSGRAFGMKSCRVLLSSAQIPPPCRQTPPLSASAAFQIHELRAIPGTGETPGPQFVPIWQLKSPRKQLNTPLLMNSRDNRQQKRAVKSRWGYLAFG